MADEEKQEQQTDDYVATINELKATTVAKAKYDKDVAELQAERKRLLDVIKTGGDIDDEDDKSKEDLRKALSSNKLLNLDFARSALSLRDKVLTEDEYDIFEAQGHTVDKQLVNGQRVADFLQNCVDKAEGDSAVFTAIMHSGLVDPLGVKNLNKGGM